MSYIKEQKLIFGENNFPQYSVVINDFATKMKTWEDSTEIETDVFEALGNKFKLSIYPKLEKHVSIYIFNEDIDDVQVDAEVSIAGRKESFKNIIFRSTVVGHCFGFPKLTPHSEALLKMTDEELRITVKFTEVKFSQVLLRNQINSITNSMEYIEDKIDTQTNKFDEISEKLHELKEHNKKLLSLPAMVKPKCLSCFKEITSKIAQCISGHMICWECKETNLNNNNEDCGMCGQPVNGRAYGWENYLKSVFGKKNVEQC